MPTHCRLPEHTTAHPEFGFDWALRQLRGGGKVCRRGWNGKGMYIALQTPDANSANTLPYIWMKTACGNRVPWLASQTDLLAADWELSTHCTAVATAA